MRRLGLALMTSGLLGALFAFLLVDISEWTYRSKNVSFRVYKFFENLAEHHRMPLLVFSGIIAIVGVILFVQSPKSEPKNKRLIRHKKHEKQQDLDEGGTFRKIDPSSSRKFRRR